MAQGKDTAPTFSPYSEWFEDWTDDQLAVFIHSMRSYAMEPSLTASLANAADIAGKLAEGELSEREEVQERVLVEIEAELDAQALWQSEAARHDAEANALYFERVAAGEQPF